MKKSEFLSAAEREGDKLFIFKAMQYRWETDQMADPHTRDEKFFLAEKEAIEYAEGLDLELGYRPEVERITIIEDDLEEEFELVDLEDIHADIETVYVGDENKGRDLDGDEIVVSYSHHMFMNYAYDIQAIQFVRETSLKYESDLRNDRDQVYSTYFYVAKDLDELAMDFEEGRVVPFNKINRGSRIVREFLAENGHPNYVENMKTSKTAEEIAKYIWDHVALIPNDVVTIYEGPKGLTYTRGTMQHRDEQFAMLMSFKLMDEKPEDIEELTEWVEYQMKQQTED